jgi:hypothetical protein
MRLEGLPGRGLFGGLSIPDELRERVTFEGALVGGVVAGSPADEAGLQQNDVIVALDGEQVALPQDLLDALAKRAPGNRVTLTVRRPGTDDGADEELTVEVTLGEHPDNEEQAYLGVNLGRFRRFMFGEDGEGSDPGLFGFDLEDMPRHFEFHIVPGEPGEEEVLPDASSA